MLKRQPSKYLDGDCPRHVLAIYDHPEFADRYTVFYVPHPDDFHVGYRGMCANPTHPLGIGQYGELTIPEFRKYQNYNHQFATRWTDLPPRVQDLVRSDCNA